MSEKPISAVFNVTPRYLRSTNLERDFNDPHALESYVLTPHSRHCLNRIAKGLRKGATDRAWRFTGNYGSGKSSFALLLAHWFSGNTKLFKGSLKDELKYESFGVTARPRYIPVLVTGSREPMGLAILRALVRVMDEHYTRGNRSAMVTSIARAVQHGVGFNDTDIAQWVIQCNGKLIRDDKADGMLILLDELGKFLEHAAFHPQQQDVFLLQKLGEAAAASSGLPLFLVGFLHQGFDAYADNLCQTEQREWEKIAGRFEEILFNQPLVQVSELVAAALRVREQFLVPGSREEICEGMKAAFRLGWMGTGANQADLVRLAPKLYPLHATVFAALVRTFRRFGQNERSLFSFLLSNEPFGLQDFADRPLAIGNTYRLPDFYDYVRANFGQRLSIHSYRSHWVEIESMVESFATSESVQLQIVKTVGVLNLLDQTDIAPTEKAIEAALGGTGGLELRQIRAALENLRKRSILFRRGVAGSYCLWSHTSVDLEAALEGAPKANSHTNRVADELKDILGSRPIVARRHYIQTGNLRYFDVRYCTVVELEKAANGSAEADGIVLVVLCETVAECVNAESIAKRISTKTLDNLLVAVPKDPLVNHAKLVADARRWEWVALNTPELNGDRFAREEVTRQKREAQLRLERRIQDLLGLRSLSGGMALRWFHRGSPVPISSARDLLGFVSKICDNLFHKAPLISNELVNRRNLSSAAAAARMRLIERIFTNAPKDLLGMDASKKPPEMSMYLSVLRRAGIHRKEPENGDWCLLEPKEAADPCRVRPTFEAIRTFLEERGDTRVKVSELFAHLEQPPLGIRAGLASLFLGLYVAIHPDNVAFYEDNSFLREVRGQEFMRLSKAPETFDVQLCRVVGLRADVFESLLHALEIPSPTNKTPQILDVVRPLCQFVAQLPDYARNTRRLSVEAVAVRDAILAAKEPVKLLFHHLPVACGLQPFAMNGVLSPLLAKEFASRLRLAIDELRSALSSLLQRIRDNIRREFSLAGRFKEVQSRLAVRAEKLVVMATEPLLKALCLRFTDQALVEDAWLESLGSLVVHQPPSRWRDSEEDMFIREFSSQSSRFRNLESIAFKGHGPGDWAEAFRFALTKDDGSEAQEVVYIETAEKGAVDGLAAELQAILGTDRRLGMAALSKVVWQHFGKK